MLEHVEVASDRRRVLDRDEDARKPLTKNGRQELSSWVDGINDGRWSTEVFTLSSHSYFLSTG